MLRVMTSLCNALLICFILSPIHGGLICKVDIIRPQWYEPEYQYVPVIIRYSTRTKTISGSEEIWAKGNQSSSYGVVYGARNPPPEPSISTFEIADSSDEIHVLQFGTNGTHVCVAVNQAKELVGGSRVESCVDQCHEIILNENPPQEILIYADNMTGMQKYDYVVIEVENSAISSSLTCYEHGRKEIGSFPGYGEFCELPKRCVLTESQLEDESPQLFSASCQPPEVDCNETYHCEYNVEAPYIFYHVHGTYFAKICNYCCRFDRCNDIRKCNRMDGNCTIYGPPAIEDSSTQSTITDKDQTDVANLLKPNMTECLFFTISSIIWLIL